MHVLYSWAVFLVVVGGLTWHYTGRPNVLARLAPRRGYSKGHETSSGKLRSKKPRSKRELNSEHSGGEAASTLSSSVEGTVSKKRKIAPPAPNTTAASRVDGTNTLEEGASMKEFARDLAQTQAGTRLAPPATSGISHKERRAFKNTPQSTAKLGAVNEIPLSSTGASSTTGADADDDLSPAPSPAFGATSGPAPSRHADVSDMLEDRAAGPAVLKLTDPKGKIANQKHKQAPHPFEVAETKKQRQQRQKREAQKARNEEAETERRKLMENQLRSARMAEGTSAQIKSAKPPKQNAWTAATNTNKQDAVRKLPLQELPLLDTFDPQIEPKNTAGGALNLSGPLSNVTNHQSTETSIETLKRTIGVGQTEALGAAEREGPQPDSSSQSRTSWADELPSEEEQMRMIKQDDVWTTVGNKKDKKKVGRPNGNADTASETSGPEPPRTNGTSRKPPPPSKPKGVHSTNSFRTLPVQDSDFRDSSWEA